MKIKTTLLLLSLFAVSITAKIKAQEENIVLKTATGDIDGTLALPENKKDIPIVLIIAGSGPTDRNGNSDLIDGDNNSLKYLADALRKNGIASVRYDKRGIARSMDAMTSEKSLRFDTYINDIKDWVELISQDKRFSKIIIAGHSEGSLLGMCAAVDNKKVDGYISIAGAGRSADVVLKEQFAAAPDNIKEIIFPMLDTLKAGDTIASVPKYFYTLFRPSVQPYMISWFKRNPQEEIKKLTIPVLILQGTTDIQVKETDARLLAAAQPKADLEIIANMNHVLKDCDFLDKEKQNTTIYNNPALPLNKEFMMDVVEFVRSLGH